jgi:hypothetical protein
MLERLKKLIASAESKASRTGRVIALQGAGRRRWTPRDYAALPERAMRGTPSSTARCG